MTSKVKSEDVNNLWRYTAGSESEALMECLNKKKARSGNTEFFYLTFEEQEMLFKLFYRGERTRTLLN